jgi:hypothetical protein
MKTVVFASTEDCARSTIAATFFDAFSLPTVRALSVSNRSERTPPEVVYAMEEVGLHVPAQPEIVRAGILEGATLIVGFGDLRTPPSVPAERWDVPLSGGRDIDHVRLIRDALRRRVWRLVAKHGWYRLQPANAFRSRGAGTAEHAPT